MVEGSSALLRNDQWPVYFPTDLDCELGREGIDIISQKTVYLQ